MSWGRGRRGVAEGCAPSGLGPRGARCRGPESAWAPCGVARCSRELAAVGDFSFPSTTSAEPRPRSPECVPRGLRIVPVCDPGGQAGLGFSAPGVSPAEGLDRLLVFPGPLTHSSRIPRHSAPLRPPHPWVSVPLGPRPGRYPRGGGGELASLPASTPTPLVKPHFEDSNYLQSLNGSN